jgi:hypothetical protein
MAANNNMSDQPKAEKCDPTPTDARDFFEDEWEVFIIRRDDDTGRLVGRLGCCATVPAECA